MKNKTYVWNGPSGYTPSLGSVINGQVVNLKDTDEIKRFESEGLIKLKEEKKITTQDKE